MKQVATSPGGAPRLTKRGPGHGPGLRPAAGLLLLIAIVLPFLLASCSGPEDLLDGSARVPHWIVGPLIALGTVSSEDLACVTAGILVSRDIIPYWYACLWCWIGIFVGDIGLYVLGRVSGERAAQTRLLRRFLTPARLHKGEHMFQEHGAWVLFSARFLPGSRMPAFIAAGILKYPLPKFVLFLAIAGLLWTPAVVGMAHWWGNKMNEWLSLYERYVWLATLLAVVLAVISMRLIMPIFTERGRHLLLSSVYRTLEWEFWPIPAIYVWLLPYAGWLGCKFRHPLAFTAANPAIPHSGLAFESKSAILSGLGKSPQNAGWIAPWKLIAPGTVEARLEQVRRFQGTLRQPFPIVLKPDTGERGHGVLVVRSETEASTYLRDWREPVIAQEFIPGLEFGIFYYRLPGADRGEILSITRKDLVSVTGNGHSNVEELILHHPRALRSARLFLRQNQDQLERIPAAGETVLLGEIGNHSRGALFTDARNLATEALRAAIDEVSRRYEGLFIGRYDVRVPSVEDLQRGSRLAIIELNGVSAESTHVYQPRYPLQRGLRDLARQWRIAYAIGAANRSAGHRVSSFGEIARLARGVWCRQARDGKPGTHRHATGRKAPDATLLAPVPGGDPGSTAA